jgi:hypothetical protein
MTTTNRAWGPDLYIFRDAAAPSAPAAALVRVTAVPVDAPMARAPVEVAMLAILDRPTSASPSPGAGERPPLRKVGPMGCVTVTGVTGM